jgi:VWFA-related protein
VVNQLNAQRTAFIGGLVILGTCGTGGQTLPLRDASVAPKPLAALSATDSVVRNGLFTIDVAVTDAAGNPVSDIAPQDFTLLDNGQRAKIRTFHNVLAPSEPAPELIIVLDTINLTPQQLTQTESGISQFLRRNSGQLEFPCLLYRLTREGLFSSLRPVKDEALLEEELEQTRSQVAVWRSGRNSDQVLLGSWVGRSERNPLSLSALGSIAIGQRDVPGRKVVVWIGPGWPVLGSADSDFDEITELSTRLREARITVDSVNVWLNPVPAFNYHDYLDAPRSQKDMRPERMALQVIATHTGGLVLESSEDLDRDIDRCVEEMRSFYTFTFNPPHTDTMDEFHDLRVEVRPGAASPALTVRAPTGYYNEPVYFDNPRPGIEKVTVAQLEELVHAHSDLLRKLENSELNQRMSTHRLDALLSEVHSERERQALTADADLSFALAPPPDEIVDRAPPPLEEQRPFSGEQSTTCRMPFPNCPTFMP